MRLPDYIRQKIRTSVKYAEISNRLQQEIIDWFKEKGIDLESDPWQGYILDPLIDAVTEDYDAEATIRAIVEAISHYKEAAK